MSVQFCICSCCRRQKISTHPASQSVKAGENATFHCEGQGSCLHWYINGVNTEDMTAAEISDRGLYVHSYVSSRDDSRTRSKTDCFAQTSYLTMAGNCLNDNTEIHCVILEQLIKQRHDRTRSISKTTSYVASLTVEDSSSIIKNLDVKQFDETLVLVSWELQFVTVNYNQTLTIQDNEMNTAEITLLNSADRLYWHEINMSNIDQCIKYSFTLNVIGSKHISCTDLNTVTTYIRGVPVAVKDAHMQLRNFKHVIQFTVNSSVCTSSLPTGIKLLLLHVSDSSGGNIVHPSSTTIPWDHLTIVSTEGVYQTEWDIHLEDNTNYQLMIISESMFGQAISDPLKISTFDVTDVQYTVHEATGKVCLKCIFTDDTLAGGCLVVLVSTDSTTAVVQPIRILIDSSATSTYDCTTLQLILNGKYLMSVYDLEKNGGISDEAAVIRNIFINLTTTTQVSLLSLSATPHRLAEKIIEQPLTATDSMTVALGILFCLSLIVIAILILGVIILRKHRSIDREDRTNKTNQDEMPAITIQMNSAYKTVMLQTKNSDPSIHLHERVKLNDSVPKGHQNPVAPTML